MRDNQAAISAVQQAMSEQGMSAEALGNRARVSPNTIRNFLEGRSWPRIANLGAMEEALGWPAGRIEDIALGLAAAPDDPAPAPTDQAPAWKPMEISYGGVTVTVRVDADAEFTDEEAAELLPEVFQLTMRKVRSRRERDE